MITADQIPDEVVEAAVKAEYEHHFRHSCKKWPEDCYEKEREGWRINQRLAIAAALSAWPGRTLAAYAFQTCLILPLPQKDSIEDVGDAR
jgi:hypothetical protein